MTTVRILHTSDVHGRLHMLQGDHEFDAWIDTGDFFSNSPQLHNEPGWRHEHERAWQREQFAALDIGGQITRMLAGRPFVYVPGNHDYVELDELLPGVDVRRVRADRTFDLLGLTVGGFAGIPWMVGYWNHELQAPDMRVLVDQCLDRPIELLVTHAPAGGILDGLPRMNRYGIDHLSYRLSWGTYHRVKYHFFGHIHERGGEIEDRETSRPGMERVVRHFNGACHVAVHALEIPDADIGMAKVTG